VNLTNWLRLRFGLASTQMPAARLRNRSFLRATPDYLELRMSGAQGDWKGRTRVQRICRILRTLFCSGSITDERTAGNRGDA
jgi:hypothetical protein